MPLVKHKKAVKDTKVAIAIAKERQRQERAALVGRKAVSGSDAASLNKDSISNTESSVVSNSLNPVHTVALSSTAATSLPKESDPPKDASPGLELVEEDVAEEWDVVSGSGPKSSSSKPELVKEEVVEKGRVDPASVSIERQEKSETNWDHQSIITLGTLTQLGRIENRNIALEFCKAILERFHNKPSKLYDPKPSSIKRQFEELLKRFSRRAEADAHQRNQRHAAKRIRVLGSEIFEAFEAAFGNIDSDDNVDLNLDKNRIRPEIALQADELNPQRKPSREVVIDWMQSLSESAAFPGEFTKSEIARLYALQDALQDQGDGIGSHPTSLSEFSDIPEKYREAKEFLTTHPSFEKLVADLQLLFEHYCSEQLQLIQKRVMLCLRRPGPNHQKEIPAKHHTAMFYIDWDVLTFLREHYAQGLRQDLGSVLAITGTSIDAYMTTVRDYLGSGWPKDSLALLDAVQEAISRYPEDAELGSILSHDPESNIIVNLLGKTMLVTGSEEFMVMVAQQLAWLVSSCQVSPIGLGHSYASFQEDSSQFGLPLRVFRISTEVISITAEDQGACWNEIVGNSVVVRGFPIPRRDHGEKGLELSVGMMAGLGGIPIATEFRGGFLLKARSFAFVPVEKFGDSVQWHVVTRPGLRISYQEIAELYPSRLLVKDLNEESFHSTSTRTFLGWCSDSTNILGTANAGYQDIEFSSTNAPSTNAFILTGGNLGFSRGLTGQLTFTFGKHNGSHTPERPKYYSEILDNSRRIHIILQDMEERRAWQTDGERLILHVILHQRALGTYKIDGENVDLHAADSRYPESVREAMLWNRDVVIRQDDQHMKKAEVHQKTFKDLVADLCYRLDALQEDSNTALPGIEIKLDLRKGIVGKEYMDLVQLEPRPRDKEAKLRKTCGNWPNFARDIGALILFGKNFGEVFQWGQIPRFCPMCETVPKYKDYLAVEISTLKALFIKQGSWPSKEQLTASGIRWHSPCHPFDQCSAENEQICKRRRIQEFVPRSVLSKVKTVILPGSLPTAGFAIFGQGLSPWQLKLTTQNLPEIRRHQEERPRSSSFRRSQVIASPLGNIIPQHTQGEDRNRDQGRQVGASSFPAPRLSLVRPIPSQQTPLSPPRIVRSHDPQPLGQSGIHPPASSSQTEDSSESVTTAPSYLSTVTSFQGSELEHDNSQPTITVCKSESKKKSPSRTYSHLNKHHQPRQNQMLYSDAVRSQASNSDKIINTTRAQRLDTRSNEPNKESTRRYKAPLPNQVPSTQRVPNSIQPQRRVVGAPPQPKLRRKPAFQQDRNDMID